MHTVRNAGDVPCARVDLQGKPCSSRTGGPERHLTAIAFDRAHDPGTEEEDATELRGVEFLHWGGDTGEHGRRRDALVGKFARQCDDRETIRIPLHRGRDGLEVVRDQVVTQARIVRGLIPLAVRVVRGQPMQKSGAGIKIHAGHPAS